MMEENRPVVSRISLNLSLSDVFSRFNSGYAFLAVISQKWGCVLCVSCWEAYDVDLSHSWREASFLMAQIHFPPSVQHAARELHAALQLAIVNNSKLPLAFLKDVVQPPT